MLKIFSRISQPTKRTVYYLGILTLVVCLAYGSIFDNHFFGDDREFIKEWPTVHSLSNWPSLLAGDLPANHVGVYRPLRSLLYASIVPLAGETLWIYHSFSLFVHLSVCILLYLFVRDWFGSERAAFIASLLFAIHPTKVEAITYITASFDTAGAIFFIISLWSYHRWRRANFPVKSTLKYLSAAGAGASFFINESFAVLPLWLVAWELFLAKQPISFRYLKERTQYHWMILALYLFARLSFLEVYSRGEHVAGLHNTLMVSLKSLLRYVQLLVFPYNISLVHDLGGGIEVSEVPLLVQEAMKNQPVTSIVPPTAVLILLVAAMWYFRKKKSVVSLSIAWFLIGLTPVINIIPTASLVSERYMYIASVGWFICLGLFFDWFLHKQGNHKSLATISLLVVVGYWWGLSYQRNLQWQDAVSLWTAEAAQHPTNAWAQFQLGESYMLEGNLEVAQSQYQKALQVYPDFSFPANRMGLIYEQNAQFHKAQEMFDHSVRGEPQNPAFAQDRWRFYTSQGLTP